MATLKAEIKIRQIAVEKLLEIDPEIIEECKKMVVAPIPDLRLLPISLKEIIKDIQPYPENSAFILAVVYYLYAPYKLIYQNIRCENGIRQAVCDAMGWKDTPTVNHYGGMLISYYKNPRWAAKVKDMAEKVQLVTLDKRWKVFQQKQDRNDGE